MTNESPSDTLQKAVALHQAGRLAEAGQLYLAILAENPEQAEVHYHLGLLAIEIGELSSAAYHFRHAAASDPHQGIYWLGHIQALIGIGDYGEARRVLQDGRSRVGLQGTAIDGFAEALAAPTPEAVRRVSEAMNRGQYPEAERDARLLIERFPDHGFGWKALARCLQHRGRLAEAVEVWQKAAELLPGDDEVLGEYANALHGVGRLEEAASAYRKALLVNPGNLQASSNLGVVSFNSGRYREAEDALREALAIDPSQVGVWLNLGLAVQAQGRPGEAERHIRQALLVSPYYAKAHHALSIALKMQGRLPEAEASERQALALEPNFPEALGNLGAIRFEQGYYAEAERCFAQALSIKPDYAEAWNNLGTCQQTQRKLLEAEASFRRAVALNPLYAEAHTNLGINLQSQGRISEAGSCWRKSLAINPDQLATQSGLVFHLTYSARLPDSDYLAEARKYGQMLADKVKAPFTDWHCEQRPERLRVGLVSGDLRNHPVGHFLRGLLSRVDSTRIEFIAYATQPATDEFSALIRPFFAAWKNIGGMSDEAAAKAIRADGVHVLIDVAGHSSHNRLPLFAWKPAPVQVSWLGYLASTGVAAIDYVLSDPYSILPADERYFTEAVWRMPDSCICFTPPDASVAVNRLPSPNSQTVTFGSFNNLAKMGDEVVAVWSRVLNSVPNSRLYLKASQLNEPAICDATRQRFAAFGIGGDRLLVDATKTSHAEHLSAYHGIDIALDTFPYPGVTTSVEALWMGVPVLTLRGDGILARAGESIDINAGLGDWIAEDEDDYVAKAAGFAGNRTYLAELRGSLRARLVPSPLFNQALFAKRFDEAIWAMWREYLGKQQGNGAALGFADVKKMASLGGGFSP